MVRTNFSRARLYTLVLFVLHLVLLGLDLTRLFSGELAYHAGYRWLFYAHLVISVGLGLFVLGAKLRPIDENTDPTLFHDIAWRVLVFFLLYAAASVSIIDQFIHRQITVYIIGSLGIAIAVYMPVRFALLLFGTAHAGFLTALVLVQHDPDLLTADIINSTLVVALAVLISHTLFTQHRRNYRHMAVIEEQSRRLERLATEDSLTKLPNRRSIAERVEQEFERSRRYGPIFAVAFADLDHFKQVNDTYSHAVGDEVLKKVAEIFRSTLRAPDVVARYGGEEFLFLFPESGASGAAAACEKIRADLEAYTWADIAPGLHMTASFGVASNVGHESPAEVIAAADRHLYEAKQGGRNCVCPVEVA